MRATQGAYPKRKHLKGAPFGSALDRLERVSKDEPSSLLGLVISDDGNFFITLTPGKNFFYFVTDATQKNKLGRLSLSSFYRLV